MKILRRVLKVFSIYVLGYLLIYPILLVLFFTFQSRYYYFALCAIMAVCGFLLWILIHYKRVSLQKISLKKIKKEVYKEYIMELVVVAFICIIACAIEIFGLYQPGMRYYNILTLFFDEKLSLTLSRLAIPHPGLMYFIAGFIFYVFYNIARLLFDSKRLYLQ